jgi:hypothetical protein
MIPKISELERWQRDAHKYISNINAAHQQAKAKIVTLENEVQ